MSIFLSENNGMFTIESGSGAVPLSVTANYINYDGDNGELSSSLFVPTTKNNLFIYTTEIITLDGFNVLADVYNFKNNTILYSGNSTDLIGLFQLVSTLDRVIMFKNLKILVTDINYAVEGYILANFVANNELTAFVENCHVLFDVPPDTGNYDANGLIGRFFGNGSIIKCSFDSIGESLLPSIVAGSGAICNSCSSSTAAITYTTFISNCWSDCFLLNDGAGGILGSSSGNSLGGGTSNLEVYSCYSKGRIAGDGAGGICGSFAGDVSSADSTSNVIIRECYSTGDMEVGGGGICGEGCGLNSGGNTSSSTVVISSCYSAGVTEGDAGGICGIDCGFIAAGTGTSSVTISCSYALNGIIPNTDFAEGTLVGTGSTLANIVTTTNNSFKDIMSGAIDGTGRVTLTVLAEGCSADYSETPRCVFEGGVAPILETFLICDNWTVDESCLELFSPQIGPCDRCPIDWSDDPISLTWPETEIGVTLETECTYTATGEQEYYTRTCESANTWGSVNVVDCAESTKLKKDIGETIVLGCVLGAVLIIVMIYIIHMFLENSPSM